jgi:hypothetical protein
MKKFLDRLFLTFTATILMLIASAHSAHAQNIQAFAANFLYFAGQSADEVSSVLPPLPHGTGGDLIYSNSVTVPAGINTLYVSFDAAGDLGTATNAMFVACLLDGSPCTDRAAPGNDSPAGWVMVQAFMSGAVPSPFADQAIHYTWCAPISRLASGPNGLVHKVQLRLASETQDGAFLEQLHVFVNGAKIAGANAGNACTSAGLP